MMTKPDPHSCWSPDQGTIQHVTLKLTADFDRRILHGHAVYQFKEPLKDSLSLDTRVLNIQSVNSADNNAELPWELEKENFLGRILTVRGVKGVRSLKIEFATSPESNALQWLKPEQTAGKKLPYLFSQCQAILARAVFPCQDTPSVRFTYDAELTVPKGLTAVMAADPKESQDTAQGTVWRFHMPHAIPSYLLALAVGSIASDKIGERTRIYAEPEVLEEAKWEFTGVDPMLKSAEAMFGPYVWDRFDLLVMPPAFPYGGMENPTLTFLTPTLIAGDRSLVNVVTHELAHSWTGNLVTNATWEDFWLNEGWTVWAERRMLEKLEGKGVADLHSVNGIHDLCDAIKEFGTDSHLTRLKTSLEGTDPDDVYSQVPYEKGYLFITALEQAAGRDVFDSFVKEYINRFKFQSLGTVEFLDYLKKELPNIEKKLDLEEWVFGTGMPDHVPRFESRMIETVRSAIKDWEDGKRDQKELIDSWNVEQKILFLNELPEKLKHEDLKLLDDWYGMTTTRNNEFKVPWLCKSAASSYQPAYEPMKSLLGVVGRGKYLKPLYKSLHGNPDTRGLAKEIFDQFKDRYHSIVRLAVERILSK